MDMTMYIAGLLGNDKPISSVLKDLASGKLVEADVFNYFAAQYRPVVMRKMRAFADGRLFASQRHNWSRWLEGASRDDVQAWLDFQSDCWMAQEAVPRDVSAFVFARVLSPPFSDRKRIAECSGPEHDRARDMWARTNTREGWTWTA